jgi:hypothetical protein
MAAPDLEATRERIAGREPVLLVEAPAGYGKTEEAVVAAQRAATALPKGKEVLFLTHTNGARDTFNRRLGRAPAVMKTIHSLAAEIVELYAAPLDLPRPLRPFDDAPGFDAMVRLAIQVLRNRPEVARGLSVRHPLILVDEYQDCTEDQHDLVQLIAAPAESRLRLFGDGLQGIFEFTGAQVVWQDLVKKYPTVHLITPWRWRRHPEMARFLVDARGALLAGEPIDLRRLLRPINLHLWEGPVPEPGQEGHAIECLSTLRRFAQDGTVVLTHYNSHALGLRRRLRGLGSFHEGSDHEPVRAVLQRLAEAEGDPPRLVELLVQAMHDWGTGMTKVYRDQIKDICRPVGVVRGTKTKILPFALLCERLYVEPTVAEWLRCLRRVLDGEHGIASWSVLRGDPLYLLARLRPAADDDVEALLYQQVRARDAVRQAPDKGFMTIHKAKGLEFEAVALPYCAGALFDDDIPSRCRMYVAISRAQSRLHLLVPSADPTPLFRL